MPKPKIMPGQHIRTQARARASAMADDFFLSKPTQRTRKRLAEIAEFVLKCHGDEAFSAGKQEGFDDAKRA